MKKNLSYCDADLVDGYFKGALNIKIDYCWRVGGSQKGKGNIFLPKELVVNFHVGKVQFNLDLHGLLGRNYNIR